MKKMSVIMVGLLLISILAVGCSKDKKVAEVKKSPFGLMPDGRAVSLFTLTNGDLVVKITNYGGTIVSIEMPDRHGKVDDIVVGYDNLKSFIRNSPYFGAIVGRYANRIANGKFWLDSVEYKLAINDKPNTLHGGKVGFDKVLWDAQEFKKDGIVGVQLNYISKDGEEGYPGNLSVKVIYSLNADNELKINYEATTDKKTVINLSNHTYFNLLDGGKSSILDHELMIDANSITPIDSLLIPTGKIKSVKGTAMDFTSYKKIGKEIEKKTEQLEFGKGYDHNFVISQPWGILRPIAKVRESKTGRVLELSSTEPGLQFYSGNFLDGSIIGKNKTKYNFRNAFVLEPQHFPDSPNQLGFPSVVLEPGRRYQSTSVYSFRVESRN
ncbi:MAG: galactose mutarotase [Melioribacteraceae bacterium]|nr:galactose mutarotase [Melioribacteraceae bacterium]